MGGYDRIMKVLRHFCILTFCSILVLSASMDIAKAIILGLDDSHSHSEPCHSEINKDHAYLTLSAPKSIDDCNDHSHSLVSTGETLIGYGTIPFPVFRGSAIHSGVQPRIAPSLYHPQFRPPRA